MKFFLFNETGIDSLKHFLHIIKNPIARVECETVSRGLVEPCTAPGQEVSLLTILLLHVEKSSTMQSSKMKSKKANEFYRILLIM